MKKLLASASVLIVIAAPVLASAQQRDSSAILAAASALAALTSGTTVSDISLSGTATWITGAEQQQSTVTLQAKGFAESKFVVDSGTSQRTEIRANDQDGAASGVWFGADGARHAIAFHNCWTDAVWLFPGLGSLALAAQPSTAAIYVGAETRNGVRVKHLQIGLYQPPHTKPGSALTLIRSLSKVDVYLDAASLLPLALTFNAHPDADANTNLPVDIEYADYRPINGVQVPFRIQKIFNGALIYDITWQSASINSGLTDATFSLP